MKTRLVTKQFQLILGAYRPLWIFCVLFPFLCLGPSNTKACDRDRFAEIFSQLGKDKIPTQELALGGLRRAGLPEPRIETHTRDILELSLPGPPRQKIEAHLSPHDGTLTILYDMKPDAVLANKEYFRIVTQAFADRTTNIRFYRDRWSDGHITRHISSELLRLGHRLRPGQNIQTLSEEQRKIILDIFRRSQGGQNSARAGFDTPSLQSISVREDGSINNIEVRFRAVNRREIAGADEPNLYHVVDSRDSDTFSFTAQLDDDGIVSGNFDTKSNFNAESGRILATPERGAIRGAAEFDRMMAKFSGRMRGFRAIWHYGDNIDFVLEAMLKKTGGRVPLRQDWQKYLPEIVQETWTGRQLARYGYTNVEINWGAMRWLGDDHRYESFQILFTKPE